MSDRKLRARAEKVVDRFLDVLLSRDSDIGWGGDSLIGRLVEFKGEIPRSSGYSGFSKVYEQSRALRDWGEAHKLACTIMGRLSERQREALCFDRAYRGRTKVAIDPFTPDQRVEVHWSDDACALHLRCTVGAFRNRVSDGYQRIEGFLVQRDAARCMRV